MIVGVKFWLCPSIFWGKKGSFRTVHAFVWWQQNLKEASKVSSRTVCVMTWRQYFFEKARQIIKIYKWSAGGRCALISILNSWINHRSWDQCTLCIFQKHQHTNNKGVLAQISAQNAQFQITTSYYIKLHIWSALILSNEFVPL